MKTIITVGLLFTFLLSCSTPSENGSKEVGNKQKKGDCEITDYVVSLGSKKKKIHFDYKDGLLMKVSSNIEGGASPQVMNYGYNAKKKLSSIEDQNGKTALKYQYDLSGRLMKIEGKGNMMTREFEYNDLGQMAEERVVQRTRVYSRTIYLYNSAGQLESSTVFDKKGENIEDRSFRFGKVPNPFAGKGSMVNALEMIYGYPVGNNEMNVTEVVNTYKKKTSYKVNGAYKMPGDTETRTVDFKTNAQGFPTEVITSAKGKKNSSSISYSCK